MVKYLDFITIFRAYSPSIIQEFYGTDTFHDWCHDDWEFNNGINLWVDFLETRIVSSDTFAYFVRFGFSRDRITIHVVLTVAN